MHGSSGGNAGGAARSPRSVVRERPARSSPSTTNGNRTSSHDSRSASRRLPWRSTYRRVERDPHLQRSGSLRGECRLDGVGLPRAGHVTQVPALSRRFRHSRARRERVDDNLVQALPGGSRTRAQRIVDDRGDVADGVLHTPSIGRVQPADSRRCCRPVARYRRASIAASERPPHGREPAVGHRQAGPAGAVSTRASTAATMCRAEMPKRSSSSAGLPLRGTSRTARRRTPMPWGATASLTASPSPPAA